MRKIANRLGGYKTVAGAFAMAFFIAVVPVRQAFASTIADQPDYSSDTQVSYAANVPNVNMTALISGTIDHVAVGILTSEISALTALNPDGADIYVIDHTHSQTADVELLSGASCSSFTTSGAYTYYSCTVSPAVTVTAGDSLTAQYVDQGSVVPKGLDVSAAAGAIHTETAGNYGSASSNPDQPFVIFASGAITSLNVGGGGGGGLTMSATTTAIFTALGIPWGFIFGTIAAAIGQSGLVLLNIFLALWPLWLGIGVLLCAIAIPWYLYHRATRGR